MWLNKSKFVNSLLNFNMDTQIKQAVDNQDIKEKDIDPLNEDFLIVTFSVPVEIKQDKINHTLPDKQNI